MQVYVEHVGVHFHIRLQPVLDLVTVEDWGEEKFAEGVGVE